jgi:hypothetical protein
MPASMRRFDAARYESSICDVKDATRLQRSASRVHAEDHFRARGPRADIADLSGKRFSDGGQERVELGLSPLHANKPEGLPRPIDLV